MMTILFPGNEAMDHHGVLGGRFGPGPDEGRQVRGEPHPDHSQGGPQGSGLPAQRNEASQRYQR